MKTILGIHNGHNASICVIRDGRVAYMVQEERIRYEKNHEGFPTQSVKQALRTLDLSPDQIDVVAFATRASVPITRTREQTLEGFRRLLTLRGMARMAAIRLMGGKGPYAKLARGLTLRRQHLADCGIDNAEVRLYGHHHCHAATAYYAMREDPIRPYLILTLDGAGEKNCATVSIAKEGRINRIAQTSINHSMGSLYALVTFLMGFVPYEHEYKLMGMAPYCSPEHAERAAAIFHDLVELRPDGLGFRKKGLFPTQMLMRHLQKKMRGVRFDTLSGGIQKFTEELMVRWARNCVKHTGIDRLLCGGGVFMNVKANKLILELPEVAHLGVAPSCGDESNSFGAAALAYAEEADHADLQRWEGIYFGDDVDERESEALLRQEGLPFTRPADIELEIAKLATAGHPVARCRGRMEFGARALGNRSILADPSRLDGVRVINQMIKKRDFWMPFAPLMLQERMDDYLVNPKRTESPHMMLTFDTKATFPRFIAAVHNADLTARAQTLRESQNPDLYRCLKHFERLTGEGVILNTSFNLHGYPICRGPGEALHVFTNSGLEYLALGPFLVSKPCSPSQAEPRP